MTVPQDFRIDVDWESAPDVSTPEFRATWARLALWFGPHSVTAVQDSEGAYRRSVYTSAYPLAEWLAFNWWFLSSELRPSALPVSVWRWSNVTKYDWLRRHNLRGVGSGMPWPDLTFVSEGDTTRAVWHGGHGLAGQPVTFLSNGDVYTSSRLLIDELTHFVDQVIERLQDAKVYDTPLAKEWQALRDIDDDEAAFARAAARLGLDPYSMATEEQEKLVSISQQLDMPLMEEFLDSADPEHLGTALSWLQQARQRATHFSVSGANTVLPQWTSIRESVFPSHADRPWLRGYAAAREVRNHLGLDPTDRLGMDDLVPEIRLGGRSAGLEGFARVSQADQPVLVLPVGRRLATAVRFAQARSLGLMLSSERTEHLLDPVSTDLTKEARAFAAELLAPADGIAQYLSRLPAVTDAAFDAVAARFNTSTFVVRHQYENQVVPVD